MGKFVFVDLETSSRADLKKVGTDNYARHESTRVLMLAAAFGTKQAPRLWQPHQRPEMPRSIREGVDDPETIFVAHNAAFERAIFNHVLRAEVPPERWICTMAMAYSLALPGALDQLTKDALMLPSDKQKIAEGRRYIQLFCKPRRDGGFNDSSTHLGEWRAFCDYCVNDVVAEIEVFRKLRKYFPDFEATFDLWAYDQRINDAGYPLDVELVEAAIELAAEAKQRFKEQMVELTGLSNPNSNTQLMPWLRDRGYPFSSIKKDRVRAAIADFGKDMAPEALELLALRSASTKTSLKKFDAMKRAAADDGVLRNTLQFCGAGRTGRWAGRVAQLQNLPRPVKRVEKHLDFVRGMIRDYDYEGMELLFGNVNDVLVSSIRSAIAAPPGKVLNVCDLSAIELCVLAWVAGSEFWLDVLRKKKDPYKSFGVHYLGKPYDEITKDERNECKPAALGCGYRLGGGELMGVYPDQVKTGLWGYAAAMGVNVTQGAARRAVAIYRELSPEIVQLWYDLENAARDCIADQQPRRVGMFVFDIKAPFMRIRLPSGRHLFYCRPAVKRVKQLLFQRDDDGNTVYDSTGAPAPLVDTNGHKQYRLKYEISYQGVHQTSKAWVRMDTHGGKLVENIVQAVARDVLVHGLLRARDAGFNVIGHVHDEIISLDSKGDAAHNHKGLEVCMRENPPWAKGLPLDAHGFQSDFYRKD